MGEDCECEGLNCDVPQCVKDCGSGVDLSSCTSSCDCDQGGCPMPLCTQHCNCGGETVRCLHAQTIVIVRVDVTCPYVQVGANVIAVVALDPLKSGLFQLQGHQQEPLLPSFLLIFSL